MSTTRETLRPMADAPHDESIIALLPDGEVLRVWWSGEADPSARQGWRCAVGWSTEELATDLVGWVPFPSLPLDALGLGDDEDDAADDAAGGE